MSKNEIRKARRMKSLIHESVFATTDEQARFLRIRAIKIQRKGKKYANVHQN